MTLGIESSSRNLAELLMLLLYHIGTGASVIHPVI
jgi:hypothetical protein